ncbi:MAG TPA: TonB-dependent receptor [Chitinophaga sp.]|uniref:SusC/RagA family TonB-linked outer membrane protein n=1 Tax=Chitinophaga sp. TaxID=1869181 RepID=UPI002C6DE9FA|nr:TonB-dependent receptor [Chitinophaga sp.]HVI44806.1 TonB-dependent receptor [Chitinophaga sp.]
MQKSTRSHCGLFASLSLPLITIVFILLELPAAAQNQVLKGRVTDSRHVPLPGVTVMVKGSNTGATTDGDGRYRIPNKKGDATLVFSFIGFEKQEIPAVSTGEQDVVMLESAKQLTETIVVGYGVQKKVDLTGAVSVVSGEMLTKRQVASASLALQGNAPGVTVTQQSGVPGGDGGTIRIRGIGSISAGQNPLILVDNIPVPTMDAVDPNSIESISILKDAAAAAVYGSRAANGVILITTRRGKQGVSVNYSGSLTKQDPTDMPHRVSALVHMKLWDQARINNGQQPAYTKQIADYEANGVDNFLRMNTDWKKLILVNNGLMQTHNLNVAVGNDKVRLFASGGYLDQNGITDNTRYKRTDLRFNTDFSLSKKISASADMVFNRGDRTWPGGLSPTAAIQYALSLTPTAPGRFNTGQWGEGWSGSNPAAMASDGGFDNQITDNRILTGTLRYKPIDGLEILGTYSSNFISGRNRKLSSQYKIYTADSATNSLIFSRLFPTNSTIIDNNYQSAQNLFRAQATYIKAFGRHQVTLLGGFSSETYKYSNVDATRINVLNPNMPYIGAAEAVGQSLAGGEYRWSMASVYTRLNYNYEEKYLLELNGRWDASSRFRKENWWKLFPSVSAGWRMSQEEFWRNISKHVNEAKLRVSYGSLGNQNISAGGQTLAAIYPTYSIYSTGVDYSYYFNNVVNTGYALANAYNPNLIWEKSSVLDAGLDMGFLNNRLTLTADYFQRDIGNMLIQDLIPAYVGLKAPFVNIGSMRNTGWEVALGWKDRIRDFNYQVQLNVSDVENKVLNIGGNQYINTSTIQKEGYALNSYYGYIADGLFNSKEEVQAAPFQFGNTAPGDIRYRDMNGDKKIDANDRVVLGNNFPRYEYSLNLSSQWRGFDLTIFIQGVGKRSNYLPLTGAQPFYSGGFQGSIFTEQLDYWTPDHQNAAYPRLLDPSITNNYAVSSYWIRSSAYWRIKNVVLGYTLPSKLSERVKIKSARVFVSGQNLFTHSKFFPGFDPEQIDAGGNFYPIMKTYTVGLNVGF